VVLMQKILTFNDNFTAIADKKLLIFGGAGSLGTCLVEYYKDIASEIVVVSRDEAKHWELRNKINNKKLKTIICDVRDPRRVSQILRNENPHNIIIAQALKQVDNDVVWVFVS